MNNHELTWYMQELTMHALGAKIDFSSLLKALENPDTRQTRYVWFHLTSFLSHAAMISKYLDPIRPNALKQERMNTLREKLTVSNESHVLPRDARDNIEHFDERIDNWVGSDGSILEVVLNNRAAYEFIKGADNKVKRILLQDELIFISENRDQTKFELKLEPLSEEITRIGDTGNRWIEKHSPYNFALLN